MSRIDRVFSDLRARGAKGLMPFLCAGRPSIERTPEMMLGVAGAGASVIEVGFPFSDPIADGPVIAAAMHEALKSHVTPEAVFEAVHAVRPKTDAGLVAMVSVSIVHRLGPERFVQDAKEAGFDGFIFPDAPIDEAEVFLEPVREAGLSASLLIAPTTPMERAERIARASTGFVYLLARTGITGEREDAPEVAQRVGALREVTDLPIACGFGIGTPQQASAVAQHADAVIVGSALVRRVEEAAATGADPVRAASGFVASLAEALKA